MYDKSPTLILAPLSLGPCISKFWQRALCLFQSCQQFNCLMSRSKEDFLKIASILMVLAPTPGDINFTIFTTSLHTCMPNLVEIGSVFPEMNEKLKTLRPKNDKRRRTKTDSNRSKPNISTCNTYACIKWFLILQIFLCYT